MRCACEATRLPRGKDCRLSIAYLPTARNGLESPSCCRTAGRLFCTALHIAKGLGVITGDPFPLLHSHTPVDECGVPLHPPNNIPTAGASEGTGKHPNTPTTANKAWAILTVLCCRCVSPAALSWTRSVVRVNPKFRRGLGVELLGQMALSPQPKGFKFEHELLQLGHSHCRPSTPHRNNGFGPSC